MLHNETVRNLMDLGLTLVQTRTYLALCKSESATAKAISKTANLARQDVYRVMPTLEKLGLVERIFDAPTRYRAIPVKRGIKNMLNNRIREHNELHKKTTELLKSLSNLPQEPEPTGSPEEDQQFVLTSEVNLLFERIAEETRTTQENIDLAGNWETNENALLYCLEEFKRALERSVKIRVVMEKPENEKLIPSDAKVLAKNPLFELRFIQGCTPLTMCMMDKKQLNLCLSAPSNPCVPSLWTNNPNLLTLAINYFEDIWKNAVPVETRQTAAS